MDRRGLDGRTAALYAAALAASWLAVRAPQRLPVLEAGLGAPPPIPAPAPGGGERWTEGTPPEDPEGGTDAADEPAEDAAAEPEVRDSVAQPSAAAPLAAARSARAPRAAAPTASSTDAPLSAKTKKALETRAERRPADPEKAERSRARATRAGTSDHASGAPAEPRRGAPAPRAHREPPAMAPRAARGERSEPARDAPRSGGAGRGGVRGAGARRGSLFGALPSAGGRRGGGASFARRAARTRRFRPLLLSKLLGPRPLKPPPANLRPPKALAELDRLRPAADARGAPVPAAAAPASDVESLDPAALGRDRRAAAHWDADQWHAGAARGVIRGGGWAWLYRDGPRWWAVAKGAEPLVRHDGVWWTRQRGTWFVLHDGEPWAQRPFHDWDAQGLFQPGSGTEMVYSKDYRRVAVIAPGAGAEVFDAVSGALLDRIPEAEMPPRRRPRAPSSLALPD